MSEKYYCPHDNSELTFMADWDDVDEWLYYECPKCKKIWPMDMAQRPIFEGDV